MRTNDFNFGSVRKAIGILVVLPLLVTNASAQKSYSSAALAIGKMKANARQVPLPGEVIVEEYVNYHTHDIPQPGPGESVYLDIQHSYAPLNNGADETIVQIGITTNKLVDLSKVAPLNVCLVIDKSGSMAGNNRIEKARQAALEFVKRMRDEDIISIVAFDHNVQVLLPAQSAINRTAMETAIRGLMPGGSTNLHGGLMAGYQEVLKNYAGGQTNKVLMLTDAITNTGIIDPRSILNNMAGYSADMQIDMTLIGVGVDLNNDLSRKMTNNFKDAIHFLNDSDDLQKVFVDEIESLLSPVGRDVQLEIEYANGLRLEHVYGYEPRFNRNAISMELEKLNSGLTQVVMLRFAGHNVDLDGDAVKARLTYYDIAAGKRKVLTASTQLSTYQPYSSGWSTARHITEGADQMVGYQQGDDILGEVKKNYLIAIMAQALKEMAILCQRKEYRKAEDLVDIVVGDVKRTMKGNYDQDVKRVLDILDTYNKAVNLFAVR